MSVADDVDELIERYQLGLDDFMKGNPEPVKELFSHREDVTLANPLGPQRIDGSRLVPPSSMPLRSSEMVGLLASKS
jgi:hypothetical protein